MSATEPSPLWTNCLRHALSLSHCYIVHHQGIIHRDIKPANLLWSADRRTVKITDFGVSHFSYAQRLAAAGAGTVPPDDPESILMDDSDLSKTAGTPMFLAPEIVSDVSDVTASGSSSTLHLSATPRRKPAITKAIDVWAFGVTLYGLLFGHLPFQADTEYEIFQVIRRQDWTVDPTMGVDQLPTGGRHQRPQPKGEETDGYLVVKLLERLLEKDSRKRITLDEVKKHPWILRDLDNPQQWLRETKHDGSASLEPTPDETSSAMSSVRFRWSSRLAHRVSEILRRPWSKEGSSRDSDDQYKNVGVQSAPHIHLARRRSTTGASHAHSREGDRDRHPRDKGRQRSAHRDNAARNKSTTDVSRSSKEKEKDFPVWAMWNSGSAAAASSSVQIQGSAPKPRRGSFPSKTPPMMLEVPSRSSRVGSPQPSPMSYSQASTPSVESPEERPRSRLSLSSFAQWKLPWKKTTPQESQTPSVSRKGSTAQNRHRLARRSEDAFNAVKPSRQSTASGSLTLAMRAASWGEVADYGRPSEDMTSLYSAERDDALDDDTLLLGAGGVAQSPVTSLPSGLLSTVSSLNSLNSTASPPVISVAQTLLHRGEVGETATAADPAAQDAAALARQSQQRSRTTSPLAQMTYNHGEISINQLVPPYVDDYDDASSFFDRDSQSSVLDFGDVELQPSTSQRYQDEDEESDDDDQVRLEVRPRRPSQSASPTERSPPRRSESSHRERVMICI